ncbi:MAG: hypothetical protein EU533_02355 [Promethearchaeota archaeon]|nr:MAG: hypothetical protein EU533_02355 [Candidatus Lokiarchaeota archaeon]
MQIFEAIEIREYPYFLTIDASEGEFVKDIINQINSHKVYLLVDHETRRIWCYNGPNSPIKLQIYGGILASMLREKLRGFYRIYSLNQYSKEDENFQEILNKRLGEGRATTIDKEDFPSEANSINETQIKLSNLKMNEAIEAIKECAIPANYERIFILIGNTIYYEEEIIESLIKEQKTAKKITKLGQLNNGFTFFNDRNYSIRFIVQNHKIQGLELLVPKYEEIPRINLKASVIREDKYSNPGDMNSLLKAFDIPDNLPDDEEIIVHEIKDLDK